MKPVDVVIVISKTLDFLRFLLLCKSVAVNNKGTYMLDIHGYLCASENTHNYMCSTRHSAVFLCVVCLSLSCTV